MFLVPSQCAVRMVILTESEEKYNPLPETDGIIHLFQVVDHLVFLYALTMRSSRGNFIH